MVSFRVCYYSFLHICSGSFIIDGWIGLNVSDEKKFSPQLKAAALKVMFIAEIKLLS